MLRSFLLGLSLLFSLTAAAENLLLLDRRYELHIPAQPATSAVIELSRQAGVQVLMQGGNLDGHRSKALNGQMTLRRALAELLPQDRFRVAQTDERTITIEKVAGQR